MKFLLLKILVVNDFSLLLFLADKGESKGFFKKTHDIFLIILILDYTLPLCTQMTCKNIILEKNMWISRSGLSCVLQTFSGESRLCMNCLTLSVKWSPFILIQKFSTNKGPFKDSFTFTFIIKREKCNFFILNDITTVMIDLLLKVFNVNSGNFESFERYYSSISIAWWVSRFL